MEPMTTPSATLDTSSQPACLRITGDWTVADLSQLGRLDTAGASLLAELLGSERLSHCTQDLPEASRALLKNVYCSVQDYCIPVKEPERNVLMLLLERIGRAVGTLWQDSMQLLGFVGVILNEEIDAIRTLGLNPMELLVVPRVLALLISLPLLTFVAMICGIVGGAVVCALTLDISPAMFLSLLQSDIGVQHFLVGLAKAPFFAFLIAAIGCLEGFKVSGSAESVGAHTTSAVVQSIFFMEMGW